MSTTILVMMSAIKADNDITMCISFATPSVFTKITKLKSISNKIYQSIKSSSNLLCIMHWPAGKHLLPLLCFVSFLLAHWFRIGLTSIFQTLVYTIY